MLQSITHRFALLGALMMVVMLFAMPQAAHAEEARVCTKFSEMAAKVKTGAADPDHQLLTSITQYVKEIINTATEKLFTAFTDSSIYQNAVNAAIALMVVIFGVGFLIGVIQASFGQVLVRLIKIGLVFTLISPDGWAFFSDYVVKFFNDGTDDIIGKVMSIGTGFRLRQDSPFTSLDNIAALILSPDMIVAIIGSYGASGPYGLMMGGLMSFALFGLVKMILKGLEVYALAFVVRSLVLGVAPIFIVFILFERTKQMFTGWLNVLVFLSLQPILYFTFISFFLVMITSAASTLLNGSELCWQEYAGKIGSENKIAMWRWVDKDGKHDAGQWDWKGSLACQIDGKQPDGKDCLEFPINVVDLLTFLILIYVAQKFGDIASQVAQEVSNSYANLDQQAKLDLKMDKGEAKQAANQHRGGTGQQAAQQTTSRKKGAG